MRIRTTVLGVLFGILLLISIIGLALEGPDEVWFLIPTGVIGLGGLIAIFWVQKRTR